jgi:hypothetical protein
MNSADAEQIERRIIAELAPVKDRLDAAEAIVQDVNGPYVERVRRAAKE